MQQLDLIDRLGRPRPFLRKLWEAIEDAKAIRKIWTEILNETYSEISAIRWERLTPQQLHTFLEKHGSRRTNTWHR